MSFGEVPLLGRISEDKWCDKLEMEVETKSWTLSFAKHDNWCKLFIVHLSCNLHMIALLLYVFYRVAIELCVPCWACNPTVLVIDVVMFSWQDRTPGILISQIAFDLPWWCSGLLSRVLEVRCIYGMYPQRYFGFVGWTFDYIRPMSM
jgi:hypothetical protein